MKALQRLASTVAILHNSYSSFTRNHLYAVAMTVASTITINPNPNPSTSTTTAPTMNSSGGAQQRKATPSFYRRPLPDTCVALSSSKGRKYFESALTAKPHHGVKSFFPLMEQHTTQVEPAYCGISTLTVCLNAFAIDPRQSWKGTAWRWYEETMLNCCIDLEEAKKTGITMKVFDCLARCQGLLSQSYYVEDPKATLEHFREQVRKACVEDEDDVDDEDGDDGRHDPLKHILVVSYNRATLGQTGTGHFSPIGAYDAVSDMVLILDTARFKYGVHWVSLPLLYEAMKSVDPDTGRSRGYILLTQDTTDDHDNSNSKDHPVSHLPMSVLFRTRMNQYASRQEYKRYLLSLSLGEREPTWEQVLRFWTKDFTSNSFIWSAAEPQVKPCSNEVKTIELIEQVRTLIAELLPEEPRISSSSIPSAAAGVKECHKSMCRPNALRALDLKPEEAIFVAYLASLEEERRKQIVNSNSSSSCGDEAKQQLLAEAELVRYAIDLPMSNDD